MSALEFLNQIKGSQNFNENLKIDWWEQSEAGSLWTRREGLYNQHERHYRFYVLSEKYEGNPPDPGKFYHYASHWIVDDVWDDDVVFVKLGEERLVETAGLFGNPPDECLIHKVLMTINGEEHFVGWIGKEVIIQLEPMG